MAYTSILTQELIKSAKHKITRSKARLFKRMVKAGLVKDAVKVFNLKGDVVKFALMLNTFYKTEIPIDLLTKKDS